MIVSHDTIMVESHKRRIAKQSTEIGYLSLRLASIDNESYLSPFSRSMPKAML